MSEEPKQGPRVVSKPEYVGRLGKDFVLSVVSATCLALGILGTGLSIIAAIVAVLEKQISIRPQGVTLAVSMIVLSLGSRIKRRVETAAPVVPLTRQTANLLPPEESLVRASSEPTQHQEKVLLRAAGSGQETPAEELLRASKPEA